MNQTITVRMGKSGLLMALIYLSCSVMALSQESKVPILGSDLAMLGPRTEMSSTNSPAFLAQLIVRGTVTNEEGEAIPGVNVMLKGTTIGAVTDVEGVFSLSVPNEGGTLVFSSIGFVTEEVPVGNQTVFNITLVADLKTLDEVVVVGYGTQKRSEVVGAVSTVNVDEQLASRAVPNVSSGLAGLVPGLAATQSTGMAGRNQATLVIRGLGTVNNSSPLVVVDGMPDVDINRIDMNDVESISVLKDAASAAVYGSRAANGVILITTKSGKGKKDATINFTSTNSFEVPTRGHDFMGDYPRSLTVQQRAASVSTLPELQTFRNGTIDEWMAKGMIDPLRYPNTDWFDVTSRTGIMQRHNLSASGGNESSNFYIAAGILDQRGIQLNNDYKQYNARINYDYKLRHNMNVGVKLNGNTSKFDYSLGSGIAKDGAEVVSVWDGDGMRFAIAGITPYDPETGRYGGVMAYGADPQAFNPYTVLMNNRTSQNRQEGNGNIYLDWTPVKGLTATVNYALNVYNQFGSYAPMPNHAYNFQTQTDGARVYVGPNAGIENYTHAGHKTMFTGRLNYELNLADNHKFNVLGVYSEEYWYDRYQASARLDRIHPTLREIDGALGGAQTSEGNSSAEGLRSYIGRFNYVGFNKYLFEATFRYDGSSKFLPGSQFGFFPSVAVGWRFMEEDFISAFAGRVLSDGKLRASYGSLGNNSGVGRYEQQETLGTSNYMVGGDIVKGFVYNRMVNRDLSWETTTVLNLGLDLGFLNNRLFFEIDYYDRLTTGMNRPSDLSLLLTGAYEQPRRNLGNLRNRGIETNVTWRDRIGGLNYSVNLNASYNRSNLELWNEPLFRGQSSGGSQVFLEMPVNYLYYYEAIGIAQTWQDVYDATPQGASPGDILYRDINGDGRIDDNDRIANPRIQTDRPTTNFALNTSVGWKGFDLVVFLQGTAGRKDFWLNNYKNLNIDRARHAATWDYWNNPWSLDNRDGSWPRLNGNNNMQRSTFWLDNMSYLRVKNVQLGYNLPTSMLDKAKIRNLRIFGSAENLITFTSYRGLDPEKDGQANDLFPLLKSYSVGVNLTF